MDNEVMALNISEYLHTLDVLQPLCWHMARGDTIRLADIAVKTAAAMPRCQNCGWIMDAWTRQSVLNAGSSRSDFGTLGHRQSGKDKEMLQESEINKAYEVLAQAKSKLFVCGERVISMKVNLETRKVSALLGGEIEGKNAEMREAAAKSLLGDEYSALEDAEMSERTARQEYDLAEIEVYRVRALLRLYGIGKQDL